MPVLSAQCNQPQGFLSAPSRSHLFGLPQQGITPRSQRDYTLPPSSESKAMAEASAAERQYQTLPSLRVLPNRYSAALLDQFGVLHDGQKPYPGAIEAVKYLADRVKKLLIISNSSRRECATEGDDFFIVMYGLFFFHQTAIFLHTFLSSFFESLHQFLPNSAWCRVFWRPWQFGAHGLPSRRILPCYHQWRGHPPGTAFQGHPILATAAALPSPHLGRQRRYFSGGAQH